jgi:hypothetical protein
MSYINISMMCRSSILFRGRKQFMFSVMNNEPKSERIQFLMEPSLRRAIKDVRFNDRIESEGDAIRQLLREALDARGKLSSQETRSRP